MVSGIIRIFAVMVAVFSFGLAGITIYAECECSGSGFYACATCTGGGTYPICYCVYLPGYGRVHECEGDEGDCLTHTVTVQCNEPDDCLVVVDEESETCGCSVTGYTINTQSREVCD